MISAPVSCQLCMMTVPDATGTITGRERNSRASVSTSSFGTGALVLTGTRPGTASGLAELAVRTAGQVAETIRRGSEASERPYTSPRGQAFPVTAHSGGGPTSSIQPRGHAIHTNFFMVTPLHQDEFPRLHARPFQWQVPYRTPSPRV